MNETRGLWRGKRLDSDEWTYGFLMKMWGKFHLQNQENENLAIEVAPSTLLERSKMMVDRKYGDK